MQIGADPSEILTLSESLIPSLVAPPTGVVGVCIHCRTWALASSAASECENCTEIRTELLTDPIRLAVVSLYKKPSKLRDWLTRYKGRDDEDDRYEPSFENVVRSMIGRFVIEHGARLEMTSGPFDAVVVVPSTSRPAPHPFEGILASLDLDRPLIQLLARGEGDLGFRRPARDGYRINVDLPPKRVLLVDDVYTTGSRINSAAVALRAAGHEVAAGVVIARRVNPAYNPAATEFWRSASAETFDWKKSPWIPT